MDIKKGDALIYLPMAYRKFNRHIHHEHYCRMVAEADESSGQVPVSTSHGTGSVDASCLIHEDCFLKICAWLKQEGHSMPGYQGLRGINF